jgi:large subunit ribosomal protein L29
LKASKMRELSTVELAKRETELKEEIYNLRFQNHTGQLENPMRLRLSRRELARVKTLLKERAGLKPSETIVEGK